MDSSRKNTDRQSVGIDPALETVFEGCVHAINDLHIVMNVEEL